MENNFNKSAEFLNQDSAATQKPCIVQSTQGFSVSYKNKFLYSKYAPQKAIINTINSLSIQPQTLFLCISPVLPYGLKELSDKLPQNCFLLGCEADSNLLDFIDSNKNQYNNIKNFSYNN